MFLIGLLIYLVAVGATILAYVVHRNSKVADFEKVLTAEHIKNIFVDENKKLTKATMGLTLITANGNEAPLPTPKSTESYGFSTTCELMHDALWRRASDIIFQPGQTEYTISYLVDGMASKQPPRTKEEMEYFLRYIKQLSDLDTEERRKPQTGKFTVGKENERYGWEVTTAGSTAGEHLKITRSQQYDIMKLEDLGLNADQLEPIKKLKELDKGLIIISGPPKSGITTTFYSVLRNHDCYMNNINTVEKKPSADIQNITQNIFTLSDTGTSTYALKVRSALRTGPDIIGIAECDDADCSPLACMAAKDGMIVYGTYESQSITQAVAKLIKAVPDRDLIADSLAAVTNQRLVRKLCDECKQAYQPNQELLRKFNIPADKIKVLYRPGEVEYDKHGKPLLCEHCQGTGFYGRTAIFETIIITEKLREALRSAKSLKEIGAYFRKSGMLYLQEQAIKKVAMGTTSINEVIRHFSNKPAPVKNKTNGK